MIECFYHTNILGAKISGSMYFSGEPTVEELQQKLQKIFDKPMHICVKSNKKEIELDMFFKAIEAHE